MPHRFLHLYQPYLKWSLYLGFTVSVLLQIIVSLHSRLNDKMNEIVSREKLFVGINNFLDDIEFMLNRRLSLFWKVCWTFLTPAIIAVIFIYNMINLEFLTYNGSNYPDVAYGKYLIYIYMYIIFNIVINDWGLFVFFLRN